MLTSKAGSTQVALEERARAILESVTDAFFSLDREYRFTYLNRTAERLLRREDGELLGKNLWEEFPAARGTSFELHYRTSMESGQSAAFVEHYPAPLDRWYEVRAYPSLDGLSVYFQDVTDRRRAEDEYRRRRDQMELVVRGANVGVWYCPLPFDELIWDDKVKEHFHLPPHARVTIDTFYARLHPDDRERTRAAIAKSVEDRQHYDIDYRTVSEDGTKTKWIRAVGRAFYDAGGQPVQFDGVTFDVSDRKLSDLQLAASEERYRLATRATNDAIWDWDLETNEIGWSDAFRSLFGHARTTTNLAFWSEHVHPADHERVLESIRRVIDDPRAEHWQTEYRFRRQDGSYADVLDRGYVVRGPNGRCTRMIGAMQDLSDRKRTERERERMIEAERAARTEAERQSLMKDEFLATLSHELRTPLNAVVGWARVGLSKAEPGTDVHKALEVITRNARAQATIVDDLLDMNRILSGKARLELEPVDVHALMGNVVETTRPTAKAKGVDLKLDLPEERDPTLVADPSRLQQIIWNLLSNAIKFTRAGGRVTASLQRRPDEIVIVVSDTGEGIAPDFIPHVFDRFRQADASTTRRHGGLGLGLSIVKQVTELHGGTVGAESAGIGRGSTFTVRLPRRLAQGSDPGVSAPPSGEATPPPSKIDVDVGGVRVLVVDDQPDARALAARLLEGRGAVVTGAGSVDEALAALGHGVFDIIVSDVGMPGQDGYDLIRQVRHLADDRSKIPAVALTAFARAEDRVRAIAAGFSVHLTKPVDAAELVTVVAGLTGRLA